MKKDISDRLGFLAEKFDIFDKSDSVLIKQKLDELSNEGYLVKPITSKINDEDILFILSTKLNEKDRLLKKVSINSDIFAEMILADPTDNKTCLQWMLNLVVSLVKNSEIETAIRLVLEDLPQANTYLVLFEDNKRKAKFKTLCQHSFILKSISDPTNINQYKSLAQLFDAIDPFIEKIPSELEKTLIRMVNSGQAEIPVKDRNFTLYIPKTRDASVIFDNFANWCTAKSGNGMFKTYTEEHKKPNGKKSTIYIIINNDFFKDKSDELYQIHFETNQLKNRKNDSNVNIFESVIEKSDALKEYFYQELFPMAKQTRQGFDSNVYLNYLVAFGFTDSLFEIFDDETSTIRFMGRNVVKIPDISRFKSLEQLVITNAKLKEIHPAIGKLTNLEMLILVENELKEIPKEIGMLKNLVFINLTKNKITSIPTEITYLDKSNGGNLHRIAISENDIGAENYKRLKLLLPTTLIN